MKESEGGGVTGKMCLVHGPASPLVLVAPFAAPLDGCRDDNNEEEEVDGGILPFLSHNLDAASTCGLSHVVARGMARRAA